MIYTPPQTATIGVQTIKEIEENKERFMPLPVPVIGDYFLPLGPFEAATIIAESHNGKTMFIKMWIRWFAKYLSKMSRQDEAIIWIDTENTIESLAVSQISMVSGIPVPILARGNVADKQQWKMIYESARDVAKLPIFTIAIGTEDDSHHGMTLSRCYRAIKNLKEGKILDRPIKIATTVVDYLQALPVDPEMKKTHSFLQGRAEQVGQDIFRIKNMGKALNAPMIIGCQSRDDSPNFKSNWRLPKMNDGAWAKNDIRMRSDRIITLWMPKVTIPVGKNIVHNGYEFEVAENQMWICVDKQRFDNVPSGKSWECFWNFDNGTVAPKYQG